MEQFLKFASELGKKECFADVFATRYGHSILNYENVGVEGGWCLVNRSQDSGNVSWADGFAGLGLNE